MHSIELVVEERDVLGGGLVVEERDVLGNMSTIARWRGSGAARRGTRPTPTRRRTSSADRSLDINLYTTSCFSSYLLERTPPL